MYSAGPNTSARTVESKLPLPSRISSVYGASVSFSDHEAVTSTFILEDKLDQTNSVVYTREKSLFCQKRQDCVLGALSIIEKTIQAVWTDQLFYILLSTSFFLFFLGSFSSIL